MVSIEAHLSMRPILSPTTYPNQPTMPSESIQMQRSYLGYPPLSKLIRAEIDFRFAYGLNTFQNLSSDPEGNTPIPIFQNER